MNFLPVEYCESSKEDSGSKYFAKLPNTGVIRIWLFLPNVPKIYYGCYMLEFRSL